ncbi:MAG: hypothetical protein WAZ12_05470 [Candidatus Absconditicoccaceae bacterium]
MKKFIIIICSLFIFTGVYSQNEIKGTSTYSPGDSITCSVTELNYLISRSYVVCSKIDTLDDGAMIKTVELQTNDTIFRFISAYLESNVFFPEDIKLSTEQEPMKLICTFALVDNGKLYESYELDLLGKKYFERILNKTSLVCINPYEGIISN